MLDYILCTLLGSKAFMIAAHAVRKQHGFVLNEAHGVVHLADVVVQGSRTDELNVRAHRPGNCICHVHNLQGVLEGSRSLLLKLVEQRVGCVAEFAQAIYRDQIEYLLEKI